MNLLKSQNWGPVNYRNPKFEGIKLMKYHSLGRRIPGAFVKILPGKCSLGHNFLVKGEAFVCHFLYPKVEHYFKKGPEVGHFF